MQWVAGLFFFEISGIFLLVKIWSDFIPTVLKELKVESITYSSSSKLFSHFWNKTRGFNYVHLITFGFRCLTLMPSQVLYSEDLFRLFIAFDFLYLFGATVMSFQLSRLIFEPSAITTNRIKLSLWWVLVGPIVLLNSGLIAVKILVHISN